MKSPYCQTRCVVPVSFSTLYSVTPARDASASHPVQSAPYAHLLLLSGVAACLRLPCLKRRRERRPARHAVVVERVAVAEFPVRALLDVIDVVLAAERQLQVAPDEHDPSAVGVQVIRQLLELLDLRLFHLRHLCQPPVYSNMME